MAGSDHQRIRSEKMRIAKVVEVRVYISGGDVFQITPGSDESHDADRASARSGQFPIQSDQEFVQIHVAFFAQDFNGTIGGDSCFRSMAKAVCNNGDKS